MLPNAYTDIRCWLICHSHGPAGGTCKCFVNYSLYPPYHKAGRDHSKCKQALTVQLDIWGNYTHEHSFCHKGGGGRLFIPKGEWGAPVTAFLAAGLLKAIFSLLSLFHYLRVRQRKTAEKHQSTAKEGRKGRGRDLLCIFFKISSYTSTLQMKTNMLNKHGSVTPHVQFSPK